MRLRWLLTSDYSARGKSHDNRESDDEDSKTHRASPFDAAAVPGRSKPWGFPIDWRSSPVKIRASRCARYGTSLIAKAGIISCAYAQTRWDGLPKRGKTAALGRA